VLLADGDSEHRRICADSLTLGGYTVIEAAEGRDALVKALTTRVSIIVTDIGLDFVDANALCEVVRHDQASANLPILIVTGASDAARLPLATRTAVNGIVIKPGPPAVILAEIRRLLRERDPILTTPSSSSYTQSWYSQFAPTRDYGSVSTTSPSVPPPALGCPICCRSLTYLRTYLRRVTRERVERWDDFDCAICGQFQYHWRTRKLRHLTNRARFRSAS